MAARIAIILVLFGVLWTLGLFLVDAVWGDRAAQLAAVAYPVFGGALALGLMVGLIKRSQ